MVLVTGGIASGKRTYVRSLGYGEELWGSDLFDHAPVLIGLEELLREGELSQEELKDVCGRAVVVCLEVGQGVVPVDELERAWRERVGRTSCMLAGVAERVVRLVCGIPQVLKEESHA